MKWIFAILVLVNLLIAGWYLGSDQIDIDDSAVITLRNPDVGDLKIVSNVELKVRADYQRKLQAHVERFERESADRSRDSRKLSEQVLRDGGCQRLGPFETHDNAQAVANGLLVHRIVSRVLKDSLVFNEGYWALVPPQGFQETMNELQTRLKKEGFDDVLRFTDGDMANSVSLGLFKSEMNAIKQVRKAESLGLVATVKPKTVEQVSFWLEFDLKKGQRFPMQDVTNSYPDVTINTCFNVAQ
jgi:hypothetical protein